MFRFLIVSQFALGVAAGWLSIRGTASLPDALRQYTLERPDPSGIQLWLGALFAVVAVIVTVGAFLFWSPARPLYTLSLVAALIAAPFFPPVVQTALTSALNSAATALAGLAIGLMYFAPAIAREFGRHAERPHAPTDRLSA